MTNPIFRLPLAIIASVALALAAHAAPAAAAPASHTCGLLPGDGAYGYTQTRGVSCQRGTKIAFRAHRKFCDQHGDCLIDPTVTPITTLYKGKVRYGAWKCRVKDGWELLSVFCHDGPRRVLYRSGA